MVVVLGMLTPHQCAETVSEQELATVELWMKLQTDWGTSEASKRWQTGFFQRPQEV